MSGLSVFSSLFPTERGQARSRLPGPGAWVLLLISGLTLAQLSGCASRMPGTPPGLAGVRLHSRAEWQAGAPDPALQSHKIEHITLHHSGVVFTGERGTDQYLRDLKAWSLAERGWVDVPYHFLIDLQGEIWQGRPLQFRGDTATEYDPTGHALVSVIGNYEEQVFSTAQMDAVAALVAALCRAYDIDPAAVRAHKDYVPSTLCPGRNLYRHLQDGSLVHRIRQQLQ